MIRRPSTSVLARALAVIALATAGMTSTRASDERFILSVDSHVLPGVLARHQLTVEDAVEDHGVYRVRDLRARNAAGLVAALQADSQVIGFELDRTRVVAERPAGAIIDQSTDAILEASRHGPRVPYYGASVPSAYVDQPATQLVGLSAAHTRSTGTVVVAVIDTGIDAAHPALNGVVVPGYDFTRDIAGVPSELSDVDASTVALLQQSTDAILEEDTVVVLNKSTATVLKRSTAAKLKRKRLPAAFGHGTMVAGLIHLIAPTALIMPLKAFNADGSSTIYDIVRAVYYAADNGARVINMSFSMSNWPPELARAVRYAHSRGVVLVSSAGNTGRFVEHIYPAASSYVLGIASTSNGDARSAFSNYGEDTVDLAAPGEAVLTTYPGGGYAAVWGTSFSTALVTGGATLLSRGAVTEEVHDDTEIVEESLLSARRLDKHLGRGRLDLELAFRALDIKSR